MRRRRTGALCDAIRCGPSDFDAWCSCRFVVPEIRLDRFRRIVAAPILHGPKEKRVRARGDNIRVARRHRHGPLALVASLVLGVIPDASALEATTSASASNGTTTQHSVSDTPYGLLAERFAGRTGLPAAVADAVMSVESGYDPDAIGAAGEIGLMQIMPATAAMLGFQGTTAELAAPETNIRYGVAYLAQAWSLADGDLCTTVMKYRAGHNETRFSVRSVDYCLAVRAKLLARGFPVTGRVPTPTFGERTSSRPCKTTCLGGSIGALPDLAALNKRLSESVRPTNIPIKPPHGSPM